MSSTRLSLFNLISLASMATEPMTINARKALLGKARGFGQEMMKAEARLVEIKRGNEGRGERVSAVRTVDIRIMSSFDGENGACC